MNHNLATAKSARVAGDPPQGFSRVELMAIGLSLAVGVTGALFPSDSVRLRILAALVSVVAALVIAVRSHSDRASRLLQTRLDRLEQELLPTALELADHPELMSSVQRALASARAARQHRQPFMYQQVVARLHEETTATIAIGNGHFRCRNRQEEFRLVNSALDTSQAAVTAVAALGLAHWRQPEWWGYFMRYVDHAREHPGVSHTRVFLVTAEEVADNDMLELLQVHKNAGIYTLALNKALLSSESYQPIVLFDNALLMSHVRRGQTTLLGEFVDVTFSDDDHSIDDAKAMLKSLLSMAADRKSRYVLWSGIDTPTGG